MAASFVRLLLLMSTSIASSSALAYCRVHHPLRQFTHQTHCLPLLLSVPSKRRAAASTSTTIGMSIRRHHHPGTSHPYRPPAWAANILTNAPEHGRLRLANLPTPIHSITIPSCSNNSSAGTSSSSSEHQVVDSDGGILSRLRELNVTLCVKRDDATGGTELEGNKVRKLEFLLADALAKGCDAIVTIGGEQSNHCRATAAASRMVGISPHLILRTRRADAIHKKEDDLGWTGNVLFDRMVGSTVYTCTPGEYGRLGSNKLVDSVCHHLRTNEEKTCNPYPIPVGGSNAVGTWGYINAVDELLDQMTEGVPDDDEGDDDGADFELDHVVFATGSGGTAAGIAVGLSLAYGSLGEQRHPATHSRDAPEVHAVGVCDNPDYFYGTMASIADGMGLRLPSDTTTEEFVRDAVTVHHGKGRGYAVSADEELDFLVQFATETGISLDPVYSGKALYHFLTKVVEDDPEKYRNTTVLFWHTGGSIGLYAKGDDLMGRLERASPVKRMDAYGKLEAGDGDNVPV